MLHLNIKEEVDIKEEMLDFTEEYLRNEDSYEKFKTSSERKIFPDNEAHFSVLKGVKIEPSDQKESLNSELREFEKIFILDEEIVNNCEIKSENLMIEKSSTQHVLDGYSGQGEKSSKVKRTSRNKPQTSGTQNKNKTNGELEKFKCAHCTYECNVKYKLVNHLLIHSNIKLFKCSECNYKCNRKEDLKRHMISHENIKLFKSSECNYTCNINGNLSMHMRNMTSNIKLFKCSECNYESDHRGNLRMHILNKHTNIKLFKCSECNYESNSKGNLKLHMHIHSNIKLFKCSECNYECNHKLDFDKHMLRHRNIRKLYEYVEHQNRPRPKMGGEDTKRKD